MDLSLVCFLCLFAENFGTAPSLMLIPSTTAGGMLQEQKAFKRPGQSLVGFVREFVFIQYSSLLLGLWI